MKGFINLLFQHNLIPIIDKPTRITKTTATATDHIMTNSFIFIETELTTDIIKSDVSDHFPIFLISQK